MAAYSSRADLNLTRRKYSTKNGKRGLRDNDWKEERDPGPLQLLLLGLDLILVRLRSAREGYAATCPDGHPVIISPIGMASLLQEQGETFIYGRDVGAGGGSG